MRAQIDANGLSAHADIAHWYADRFSDLGRHPLIREHVFGTSLRRPLRIGYPSALPGPGQTAYAWVLELWFDDAGSARAYLGSDACAGRWDALTRESQIGAAALCRGQEMLVIAEPTPPVDA